MNAGWRSEKLGDVCEFVNRGISPKYLEEGGVCVVNQKCIRDHLINYNLARRHDPNTKAVSTERFIRQGDVLVNSTGTGTLGRVAQVRRAPSEKTTVDSHVTIVRPLPGKFYEDFFGYALITIEEAIKESGEGCGGQTELARKALANNFSVTYPTSQTEQRRIVGILDEAFEGISKAVANAEANLNNARELFESELNAVFSSPGPDWMESVIEKCIKFIDYRGRTPKKTEGGMRLITAKNVKMGFLQAEPQEFVDPSIYKSWMTRGIPKKGDVLFTTEAPLGNVAQLDTDDRVVFAQRVIIMQPNKKELDRTFLKYMLLSASMQQRIHDRGTGATAKGIKASLLKKIEVSFPKSVDGQQTIVAKLDELAAETKRLEAIYEQKMALLDELKQSLLHKAFSGEL